MANMNNFQGKRPDQYKNSEKLVGYSILGIITILVILTLLGSCTTTKNIESNKPCCKTEKTK